MSEAEEAIAIVEAAGFVVLREKSYRAAQERQRRAECQREYAEENRARSDAWARDCLTEERRLRERLTFVYGVAQRFGATIEDLRSIPAPAEPAAPEHEHEFHTGCTEDCPDECTADHRGEE